MKLFVPAAALLALAACTDAEFAAAIEDPNGFACRERGASLMSVSFEETEAYPINTDIFGTANYSVSAGGTRFRCTVSDEGTITSFRRV